MTASQPRATMPPLVPVPKSYEPRSGGCLLPASLHELLDSATLPLWGDAGRFPGVALRQRDGFGPEEYRLEAGPNGVEIAASTGRGALWGLRTLAQLVRCALAEEEEAHAVSGPGAREEQGHAVAGPGAREDTGTRGGPGSQGGGAGPDGASGAAAFVRVPACRIRDYPDFPHRGVMLDISRNRVPTLETLFRLVRLFSALKFNQLQLYTEHTFAYRSHPLVWAEASPLGPDEIRELDRFCAARGIELIPNQNSLGHMERWLKHPEYAHLAECPEGFTHTRGVFRPVGSSLSPAVPESLRFLEGLYDELLPCFESSMFNVGGDEPWELGRGRSAKLCEERGTGRVYLEFMLELHRMVTARDREVLIFGDIITRYPELIPELPDDAVVLDWGYEANHPFAEECRLFREAEKPFWVLPGTSSWQSIAGRWSNARGNIRSAAEHGRENGARGFVITDWGDNGHWQQLPVSFAPWTYAAAVAWGVAENAELEVATVVDRHVLQTGRFAGAGEALVLLGDAYTAEPVRLSNATLLSAVTLTALHPYYQDEITRCSDTGFVDYMKARIGEARDALRDASAGLDELVREEIDYTARLLEFAAQLEAAFISAGHCFEGVAGADARALRARLRELQEEFAMLWRARSRPGGLDDSLEHFRALGHALSGA